MKISVICSNYNSNAWIDDYLHSLNAQFLSEFEAVFVDANSTDDSLNTISKFEFRKGISSLIIPYRQRITIYEAWNCAVQNCKGNFVVNYNTDDHLFPSALGIYEGYVSSTSADVIYGNNYIHADPKTKEPISLNIWPNHSHEILKRMCICGPFPCVRKQAIESVGYFSSKYKSSGDYDMWLSLSKAGRKFLKIPEFVGSFYHRSDSVSNNLEMAQAEDREIQAKHL